MAQRSTIRKVNRRTGARARGHVLDVRIRTSTARRLRQEKVSRWMRNGLLCAFLVTGSIYGVRHALDRFFYQNANYAVKRITLDLDGLLTREEALAETGLVEGVNIFSVDLAKVESTLKAIPEVESVRVARELPDHVRVTLVARQPVAWVAPAGMTGDPTASEKSFLIDARGSLMRMRHVSTEALHLPVIYGLKGDNIREGERVRSEEILAALSLLETLGRHPESLLKIRTMDVSRGYRIDVVNDTNAHIIFSPEDFEEQLARLQKLLVHCSETGRSLETVNLMVRRNTPVTFVMAAAPPVEEAPPAPVPVKTRQKTRRN